ncbi:MAG: enoyl-CoA hydratase-related protein [Armatimonadota bacterium]
MAAPIRTHVDAARLTILLSRPEVHNAFDEAMIEALDDAFRGIAGRDNVRYVVLAGEGASFCAGADVGWMRRMAGASPDENRADARRLADMLESVATCPKPVIARVHGAALGGGVGLVAACDLAVAVPGASFRLSEVRLGLTPAVIFPLLLRKVTRHEVLWAALTGERFSAARARDMGLVHEVAGDLDTAIDRWAQALLAGGPHALAAVKELFNKVPQLSWESAREMTVDLIARLRAGSEAREGMQAFFERRRPDWSLPGDAGR